MRIRTLILGGAVGAAVAYLFDPVSGQERRTRLRDQATAKMRETRQEVERATDGMRANTDRDATSPSSRVTASSGPGTPDAPAPPSGEG